MDKVGSSVSNRFTKRERDIDLKRIEEDYARRTTGSKSIGTHTLGEEYKTSSKT